MMDREKESWVRSGKDVEVLDRRHSVLSRPTSGRSPVFPLVFSSSFLMFVYVFFTPWEREQQEELEGEN